MKTLVWLALLACAAASCRTSPVEAHAETAPPDFVVLETRSGAEPRVGPREHVTRDGVLAFALDGGTVVVRDRLNDREVARTALGADAVAGALTPDDTSYVAVCPSANALVFVNTASHEVVARVEDGVGPEPVALGFTPDGRHALVANRGAETVSILDVLRRRVVGAVDVGAPSTAVRIEGTQALVSCAGDATAVIGLPEPHRGAGSEPSEVVVLGTLHDAHLESIDYGLDVLEALVREIAPDYVLAEIPPNRFERAQREFRENGFVEEPRVSRFPEYVDVIFPLTRDMGFTIVPTAAWTEPMDDYRQMTLERLRSSDEGSWQRYEEARARSASAITSGGELDDPRWIHTDAYDAAAEEELSVYDELFNDALGPGGWTNVNRAHYANIERVLDEHRGEGKRFLVTYGAYHKGWLLRELAKRDDVVVLDVGPFLDAIGR